MRKILAIFSFLLILLSSTLSAEKKESEGVKERSWKELFTEPVETIYFIMEDGVGFRHSNQDERIIYVSVEELKKSLKTPERAYQIKDIAIVIHNHFVKSKFSDSDRIQYRTLKKQGFTGRFLLYCRRTKEVYDIEKER